MWQKRLVMPALGLAILAMATGCGNKAPDCAPMASAVNVCVNGTALLNTAPRAPHAHEQGGYYMDLNDLARALHVNPHVSGDHRSVVVNGKAVIAASPGAKGVHDHDHVVFVPVKEFAEAAGYKAAVDTRHNTVSLYK